MLGLWRQDALMSTDSRPLRFSHHALAVLGPAMLGSTVFSLIWTVTLAVAANGQVPRLVMLGILFWLGVFMIALPAAGFALSLLFPIVRRQTFVANCICLVAGATTGIILAPLGSAKLHGATLLQICTFAFTGAAVAGFYLIIGRRLNGGATWPLWRL
jgi:hypothetical protein